MSAIIYSADPNPQPDDSPSAFAVRTAWQALNAHSDRLANSAPRVDPVTGEPWRIYTPTEALERQQLQVNYQKKRGTLRLV